jgi:hypothetical protein
VESGQGGEWAQSPLADMETVKEAYDFQQPSGKTEIPRLGKENNLSLFGSFQEKTGQIFFPPKVAVVDERDQPDA